MACKEGSCVEKAPCTICEECQIPSDCGNSPAYSCLPTADGRSKCTKTCTRDADCDGDSTCITVYWGNWGGVDHYQQLCGTGSKEEGSLCSASRSCVSDAPNPGCPNLWNACTSSRGCGDYSDTCVQVGNNERCTCTCHADEDCGTGGACRTDPTSGLDVCFPKEMLQRCGDTLCGPGQRCVAAGVCQDLDPCLAVTCGTNQLCKEGSCIDRVPAEPPAKKAEPKKSSRCSTGDSAPSALSVLFAVGLALWMRRRRAS
jgi:MYXO-CTERM domain-containing protein